MLWISFQRCDLKEICLTLCLGDAASRKLKLSASLCNQALKVCTHGTLQANKKMNRHLNTPINYSSLALIRMDWGPIPLSIGYRLWAKNTDNFSWGSMRHKTVRLPSRETWSSETVLRKSLMRNPYKTQQRHKHQEVDTVNLMKSSKQQGLASKSVQESFMRIRKKNSRTLIRGWHQEIRVGALKNHNSLSKILLQFLSYRQLGCQSLRSTKLIPFWPNSPYMPSSLSFLTVALSDLSQTKFCTLRMTWLWKCT